MEDSVEIRIKKIMKYRKCSREEVLEFLIRERDILNELRIMADRNPEKTHENLK